MFELFADRFARELNDVVVAIPEVVKPTFEFKHREPEYTVYKNPNTFRPQLMIGCAPSAPLAVEPVIKPIPTSEPTEHHNQDISFKDAVMSLFADIMAEDEPDHNDNLTIEDNPRAWILDRIKSDGLWQSVIHLDILISYQAGDAILVLLQKLSEYVDDYLDDGNAGPLDEMERICRSLLINCRNKLMDITMSRISDDFEPEYNAASVYRTFVPALKFAQKKGYIDCPNTIRDLTEETTIPAAELDCPSWVDGYTGDVDKKPEFLDLSMKHDIQLMDELELQLYLEKNTDWSTAKIDDFISHQESCILRKELGWGERELKAFQAAQETFDNIEFEEEDTFDEIDIMEPTWMKCQKDEQTSDEMISLRIESKKMIDDIRNVYYQIRSDWYDRRSLYRKECATEDYGGIELFSMPFKVWVENHADAQFNNYREKETFINWIAEKVDEDAKFLDLAVIYMQVDGLGFDISDLSGIGRDNLTLVEFMEENEQVILDAIHDSGLGIKSTDYAHIEAFANQTVEDYIKVQSSPASKDLSSHPAFMTAQFDVLINSKDTMKMGVDGKIHNLAVAAAWENLRQVECPEGNKAFHAIYDNTGNYQDAMKAFWPVYNKSKKEANKPGISMINKNGTGLILTTNWAISWNIAAAKIKNNELNLPAETRAKLKEKLVSLGFARDFVKIL